MNAGRGPGGWRRGLLLALLQAGLLLGLGGQLLFDRFTRPRGWIRTEPVDPTLPIRGRYVNLSLLVPAPPGTTECDPGTRVLLRSEGGRVRAELATPDIPRTRSVPVTPALGWAPTTLPTTLWRLQSSVAFFLPPEVADPSRRPAGEQLWVEVTLPAEGPPRPIRLGTKRDGGPITPLGLR